MSRQAYSLDVLLAEVNAAHPGRSTASDGGIGDAAHSSRESDHNPNAAGVWRARDFTHDPPRFDADEFAQDVADMLGIHPALKSGAYVIRSRRIISADRLSEGWRTYTGSNPHDKHCHVSVVTAAVGYDSRAPWFTTEEIALTPDDLDKIRAIVRDVVREEVAAVTQSADRLEDQATTILGAVRQKGKNSWNRDLDIKALVREVLTEVKA